MLQLFVIATLLGGSAAVSELHALRFGETKGDYIEWRQDMSTARREVSVCTWLRKRHRSSAPIVLIYNSGKQNGIILGDDGYYNFFAGTNLNLQNEYNVPEGEWFHVCWLWSYSSRTIQVFLNGEKIGSQRTKQKELSADGVMSMGNRASGHRDHVLGGDVYKFNIFNRLLTESEIGSMSSDICSLEEKNLAGDMIVKWEEIILKERTGSVTEIPTGSVCMQAIDQRFEAMDQRFEAMDQRFDALDERLELLEGVLTNSLQRVLNDILERLYETEQQLADTKSELSRLVSQQDDN